MMKKLLTSFFYFCLCGLSLSFNSCGQAKPVVSRGTETTNPMAPTSNAMIYGLCGVISRCHALVTFDRCRSGILSTSGFGPSLGLSSMYDNLSDILGAEQAGALVGNTSMTDACYDRIVDLQCWHPSVQAAYNPFSLNPFAAAPAMVPTSFCNQSFASPTYESVIVADNPMGYWRLDETSGPIVADTMGNFPGILLGSPAFGAAGALANSNSTSMGFSRTNSASIDMNLSGISTSPGSFVTVEYWMKWSGREEDMMPFGFRDFNNFLWNSLNGYNGFGFNTENSWPSDLYWISGTSFANRWVHVVAVFKNMWLVGDMADCKLYIDSVLQTDLVQLGYPNIVTVSEEFRISSWPTDQNYVFDGELDEFSVYNYELTPEQVLRHYQAGLGNF